ncbi:hypothetical protein FIBSPDRAFT_886016 [Athelia psychrophila]|uniref:Uncharacterized protein n=1 Tax=Athelia psychrophila TaxID=1759441 RepID=A0A166RCS7_9AGAM|nr:hypothetical protein FIBSPDRAFT_886016 [Fibularhizoctonia sp. CBS 109695]
MNKSCVLEIIDPAHSQVHHMSLFDRFTPSFDGYYRDYTAVKGSSDLAGKNVPVHLARLTIGLIKVLPLSTRVSTSNWTAPSLGHNGHDPDNTMPMYQAPILPPMQEACLYTLQAMYQAMIPALEIDAGACVVAMCAVIGHMISKPDGKDSCMVQSRSNDEMDDQEDDKENDEMGTEMDDEDEMNNESDNKE